MFIFLLLTFPVFIFFLLHLERERSTWVDFITFKDHGVPFVRGLLASLPALIVLFIFRTIFNETFNPAGLFFYYLFSDHFIYIAVLSGIYLFFVHFFDGDDSYLSYSVFAGGFFTVVSIISVIQYYNQFDSYQLFLLPLLRLSAVFLTSCIVTRILSSDGLIKILLFSGVAAVPVGLGVITYLYKNNYIFFSLAAGILLFAASFFIMVKFKE